MNKYLVLVVVSLAVIFGLYYVNFVSYDTSLDLLEDLSEEERLSNEFIGALNADFNQLSLLATGYLANPSLSVKKIYEKKLKHWMIPKNFKNGQNISKINPLWKSFQLLLTQKIHWQSLAESQQIFNQIVIKQRNAIRSILKRKSIIFLNADLNYQLLHQNWIKQINTLKLQLSDHRQRQRLVILYKMEHAGVISFMLLCIMLFLVLILIGYWHCIRMEVIQLNKSLNPLTTVRFGMQNRINVSFPLRQFKTIVGKLGFSLECLFNHWIHYQDEVENFIYQGSLLIKEQKKLTDFFHQSLPKARTHLDKIISNQKYLQQQQRQLIESGIQLSTIQKTQYSQLQQNKIYYMHLNRVISDMHSSINLLLDELSKLTFSTFNDYPKQQDELSNQIKAILDTIQRFKHHTHQMRKFIDDLELFSVNLVIESNRDSTQVEQFKMMSEELKNQIDRLSEHHPKQQTALLECVAQIHNLKSMHSMELNARQQSTKKQIQQKDRHHKIKSQINSIKERMESELESLKVQMSFDLSAQSMDKDLSWTSIEDRLEDLKTNILNIDDIFYQFNDKMQSLEFCSEKIDQIFHFSSN